MKHCQEKLGLYGLQEHIWAGSFLASSKERFLPINSSGVERKRVKTGPVYSTWKNRKDKVFNVLHILHRIILIRLVICKVFFTILSVYALRNGLEETEKDRFYDQLQSVLTIDLSHRLILMEPARP